MPELVVESPSGVDHDTLDRPGAPDRRSRSSRSVRRSEGRPPAVRLERDLPVAADVLVEIEEEVDPLLPEQELRQDLVVGRELGVEIRGRVGLRARLEFVPQEEGDFDRPRGLAFDADPTTCAGSVVVLFHPSVRLEDPASRALVREDESLLGDRLPTRRRRDPLPEREVAPEDFVRTLDEQPGPPRRASLSAPLNSRTPGNKSNERRDIAPLASRPASPPPG